MIGKKSSNILSFSDRLYRLLLALYPADYRSEYGPHMAQLFRDLCSDAYRLNGVWGVLGSWLPLLLDLMITVVEERRKGEIRMSPSMLARWSGLILVIGGGLLAVASFSQLQPGSHYSFRGIYQIAFTLVVPAIFLLALGLTGVRAQFATRLNLLGKWGLGLAIAGAITKGFTFGAAFFSEALYTVSIAAFAVHLFGIVLFGISAMQTKALPRGNVLPILIGLLPSLRFLNSNFAEAYGPQYAAFGTIALMGLGYVLLGYIVYTARLRQARAAA